MKTSFIALLAFALPLVSFAADPPALPTLDQLRRAEAMEQRTILKAFEDAQEKFTSFQTTFSETMHWKAFTDETQREGRIAFLPPNNFRYETTKPHASLTVSNGKKLWIYYPEFKEAEEFSLESEAALNEITNAINVAMGFRLTERGREQFDVAIFVSEKFYVFELTPHDKKLKRLFAKMRLWFDHEFIAHQSEIITPAGDSTRTRFLTPKRNETLPPDTFQFVVPEGVKVVRPLEKK